MKHHGVDVTWRAVKEGFIPENKISGELGELVVDNKIGRNDEKERIFSTLLAWGSMIFLKLTGFFRTHWQGTLARL